MSSLLPTDSVPGEGECLPQTSEASSESDMGEANRGSGPLWSAVSQPETIAAETTGDLVEGITTNAAALTRTHGDRRQAHPPSNQALDVGQATRSPAIICVPSDEGHCSARFLLPVNVVTMVSLCYQYSRGQSPQTDNEVEGPYWAATAFAEEPAEEPTAEEITRYC